jgi:predicted extracellular nuclease
MTESKKQLSRLLSGVMILILVTALMPFAGAEHVSALTPTAVFINEIHYDNDGGDAGEAIEIAGPAGTDLGGWSLVLYNGSGGAVYDTELLTGLIPDQQAGYGTLSYPISGIQNGSPDGMALVGPSDSVIQFLSYEGTFTAVGGPADGMTSTDIGVSEPYDTPVGYSLQLSGTGLVYEDFSWSEAAPNTFGAVNTEQTFSPGAVATPSINEFSANTAGTDVEYVEVFGPPDTDLSAYTILEIEGDSNADPGVVDEVIPLGTTDASGFWLADLDPNSLENGTITLLLVNGFTGEFEDDLDTDNDGEFDVTPWSELTDAVAVFDGDTGDLTYGTPTLGPNYDGVSSYAPGGASRYPDGFDTEAPTDWVRNDFDLAGIPGYPGSIGPGEAYNTPGEPNQIYVPPPEACGDPYTPIYEVQGNGAASPLVGTEVALEGIVVGDFQNNAEPDNGDLNGFHVQDPTGDGDPATSDGVFIYAPGAIDVAVGDAVRVRGTVSEYYGLTEVAASQVWLCSTGNSVAPTPLSLPVEDVEDFEPYEGMLVTLPQTLYISEYYNFDRYGEIVVTTDRQNQPTAVYEPGSPEQAALAEANLLSRITLDDGRTSQNPDPALHPNGAIFDMDNLFRGGDTVANVTGVVDYSYSLYRIQPVQGADYTPANPRTAVPADVGGNLRVASFNVLNYFTTIDTGDWICGPNGDQECRGADTPEEFTRQRDKIIAALTTIDADVVGLIEIENHPEDVPTADLVSGLNDVMGAGTYDYIATGAIGTDAIRLALIYKPATVTPVGGYAILDSSVDPRFLDDYNRPVLAQAFQDNNSGGIFTVAVNHLKSKGSDCNAVGDPDLGDGASNCNLTRMHAAEALVDWLAGDPTGSGDTDALIIGDLNSYDKEDPIDALLAGGYTDLVGQYLGEYAYSYLFDGQLGYLDYALANAAFLNEVAGVTVWHINADEPDLIDYDMTFKQDAQDALYAPDAYRSSDHDPVIVGLSVCEDEIAPTLEVSVSPDMLWPPNHKYVTVVATVQTTDNQDPNPAVSLVSVTSNEPDEGLGDGDMPVDIVIVDDTTFYLRAERSGLGEGRVYTIVYQATDTCGNTTLASATVTVPRDVRK